MQKRPFYFFLMVFLVVLISWPLVALSNGEGPMAITIAGEFASSLSTTYEDPLLNFVEKKFNVNFVPLQIDSADPSYSYRLRAAANEFPDVMLYDDQWDFLYFIQANALRALPSSLSAYPHLRQMITYPYAKNLQYDGMIWGIPRSLYAQEKQVTDYCILVHKEYLGDIKEEELTSIEDWQAFLSTVAATDEEVIPLTASSPWAMFNFTYFYAPFANTWLWSEVVESYIPGFYTNEYAQRIKALRILWDGGLLDPDFIDINCGRPTGTDRFLLKQAAGIIYPTSSHVIMSDLICRWAQLYPQKSIEDEVEVLFLPSNEEGEHIYTHGLNTSAIYFSANVNDEKMERILSVLDFLSSPEGLRLRRFGLEGEDYVLKEDGTPLSILGKQSLYDKYPSYSLLRIFPNLDQAYFETDDSLPAFVRLLGEKSLEWKKLCKSQQGYFTSLMANTILPSSGTYFNPNLTEISFRMLTAQESVEETFEIIKEEFRDQGIEQFIFKVTVNMK